ncbi:hypothetical protein ACHHYP_12955 [Achlya hypogyna]|uniref:Uncharacterized protein n=1 Tax=Achlya hypogyna TaxID=1202772 RepID=A0A1V9ZGM3_ACHHY|nr:hypothetical protein ACHHYP_12955 [Achlya hypogyna]
MSTKKRAKQAAKKPSELKKSGDIVRVVFDSQSYQPQYDALVGKVARTFPQVDTVNEEYPLPPSKLMWWRITVALQAFLTIFVMFGDQILAWLGMPMGEAFLQKFVQYRFVVFPLVMILSPMRQMLASTGAFEVYINDKQVYSALATGRSAPFEVVKAALVQAGIKAVAPAQ